MKKTAFIQLLIVLTLLCLPSAIFAAEEEPVLPDSGVLASASNLPAGDYDIDAPWGGINIEEENVNPIIGSINRAGQNIYEYTVKNVSEDRYTARLSLEQKNKAGKTIKTSRASVSLAAGASKTAKLRVGPQTVNVAMKLGRWNRKKKEMSQEELKEELVEKKAELKKLEGELPSRPIASNVSKPVQPKKLAPGNPAIFNQKNRR